MSSSQATAQTDLDAVSDNFERVRELAPQSRIMAIIKADAYGHGAVQVARKLQAADAFGVARVSEAVKLREAGISGAICLLEGASTREELNLASIYELQVTVHSEEQLELMTREGARRKVWLKIDTGMGRLGIRPEKAAEALDRLGSQELLGIMTHFARADEPGIDMTDRQVKKFLSACSDLKARHPAAGTVSLANSAGIIRFPQSHGNWVRPGLMLYGASPMVDLQPDHTLSPAMHFTAPVIAVRRLEPGESVGYGSLWTAESRTRIAVVAAGYGDGYPREIAADTPVLINGERRPVRGRVSMDMMTVQLEDRDIVQVGDHVTLWGGGLPIEEIAKAAGTVTYTLMCSINARVRRTYRGEVRG